MKILLGMSGGIDSTYAALKLKEEGHEVEGAVLIMHGYTETESAEAAAKSVGIPLHKIDCRDVFEAKVIDNFVNEYLSGKTPNPCVICNSEVKFRILLDYARKNGFDKIATGHYAKITKRICDGEIRYAVTRATDKSKDQTYVLWRLSQDILSSLCFPLSADEKKEIREEARKKGSSAADRGDSQEICFVPSGDYAGFIESRTHPSPHGYFINNEGKVLGEHKGIIHYTVGQRKGLGIAMGQRIFVTKIDPNNNTVTLSFDDSFSDTVNVSDMVFSGMPEMATGGKVSLAVKLRYLAAPAECVVEYSGGGRATVKLTSPVRAVTPGQSAVFYDGDVLVAGGFIDGDLS